MGTILITLARSALLRAGSGAISLLGKKAFDDPERKGFRAWVGSLATPTALAVVVVYMFASPELRGYMIEFLPLVGGYDA